MGFGRNNLGSAMTRKARKALKGRVEAVTVRCSGYVLGGEVTAEEIEPLMAARQILTDAGITCSALQTQYKTLGPLFYITVEKQQVAACMIARLSVFVPLKNGDTVVHVFNVEADQPLDWFKSKADELAAKCLKGAQYNALHVEAV